MSAPKPGDEIAVDFTVSDPSSGSAADADALPTAVLVRNGSDTGEAVTIANKVTGVYKAAVTIPAGYEAGDQVQIRVAATVGGVAGQAVVWGGTLDTKRNADLNDAAAGGSVQILPLASTVSVGRVESPDLDAYQFAGYSFTFAIVDSDGDPVDLTGSDVRFTVFDPTTGAEQYTLAAPNVSIAGANGNQVTVASDDTNTGTSGRSKYVLRNLDTDRVLAIGTLTIVPAADAS